MSATTTAIDPALRERIAAHHGTFSPVYGGYLSDHGPMAALALSGLGADGQTAADYLTHLQTRLEPLETADEVYRGYLDEALDACLTEGAATVLARELPALISGWAWDAYHPLIRIAYGHEFGVPEEVAAGLAYLRWRGPDPVVEQLACKALAEPQETTTLQAFRKMHQCRSSITTTRNFSQAFEAVTQHPAFARGALSGPNVLSLVSTMALAVFSATHNFFALHLVTGAHAYRTLYAYAGPLRDPVFSLGILGGYAAVGAPLFEPLEPTTAGSDEKTLIGLLNQRWPDEHDVKLYHSCLRQTEAFGDLAYEAVARRHVARR